MTNDLKSNVCLITPVNTNSALWMAEIDDKGLFN
jgi:hypothetical protein